MTGSAFFSLIFLVLLVMGGIILWGLTSATSRSRGLVTYLVHILILFTGWFFGGWTGVLLLSLPILFYYYYFLCHLSLAVVPASMPGDLHEAILRLRYFFFYTWGLQYPAWAVTGSTGRTAEVRIKGNPTLRGTSPGLILAKSHQVVGLTTGLAYSRIDTPGTIFTKEFERPLPGVVDLRTQLRTFWVDIVSSDGIPYKALLFATFSVDREAWSREIVHQLMRENRLLKDAREPDYTTGSFHFSRARLRTLLSATGVRSSGKNQGEGEITYWDEMVLYHIEKATSEILSQRRFDETWQPSDDHAGASAADDIAEAIKLKVFFNLLCKGVRFSSCRLVNFEFKPEKMAEIGEVERQQIATWQADWQKRSQQTRASGKAEAVLLEQEARAYATASLLTSLAEGLNQSQLHDPDQSRSVVAIRFIGALEELIKQQPEGEEKKEAATALDATKRELTTDKEGE